MKNNKPQFLLMLLALIAGQAFASGQVKSPESIREKVALVTDRSLYIVGEQVQFYVSLWQDDDVNKPVLSQVLYCEIITPYGNKIAANKFVITASSAEGCISIPDTLLTGYYYVRAYTKLMRNYGPNSYGYKQIRIVNPKRTEILATGNQSSSTIIQLKPVAKSEKDEMFKVSLNKSLFAVRDTISFSLSQKESSLSRINSYCISVVPENSDTSTSILVSSNKKPFTKSEYFLESRGLSITGKVTESAQAIPVADKKVNLSIIGEGCDFMAARTDSAGRFFFALPYYSGTRDIFLCTEKSEINDQKIWIDNDFCNLPVHLPAPKFSISEKERQDILNMAVNTQINSHFKKPPVKNDTATIPKEIAFYGRPVIVITLDSYIQLPTLEEYFNELPTQVRVRKHKGKFKFNVQGSAELAFYDPLVLVDWVAIDDITKILACAPHNISRIEVVNQLYVKGNQTYGGIISIITKKGDFAGIDLPSSGIFLNFHFLSDETCLQNSDLSVASHPDARNTLFWKPGIRPEAGRIDKFAFTAPDTPGRYSVNIEGITAKGEIFHEMKVIDIKSK